MRSLSVAGPSSERIVGKLEVILLPVSLSKLPENGVLRNFDLEVAVGDHQVAIAVTYRVRSTNTRNKLV
jgi:hypothetical protein